MNNNIKVENKNISIQHFLIIFNVAIDIATSPKSIHVEVLYDI